MAKLRYLAAVFALALGLGASGCGKFDCSDSGDKIYDECHLVVTLYGKSISKQQFVDACDQDPSKDKLNDCLDNASCSKTEILQCLQKY